MKNETPQTSIKSPALNILLQEGVGSEERGMPQGNTIKSEFKNNAF